MGIRITSSGMHTTVQDLGRNGFQRYGFSSSGAMDQFSFRLANLLVGNEKDEAGLEMMVTGSSFVVTYPNTIAVTGAECHPKLNGEPVKMYRALHVETGDKLTTGTIRGGTFSYIAFAGGMDTPEVMNSRSTSTRYGIGGFKGRALKVGDEIGFKEPVRNVKKDHSYYLPHMAISDMSEKVIIRVIPASQTDIFTEKTTAAFFEREYKVSSKSDRMGYRLEGQVIETERQHAVISEATVLGDIQVPPDGQPIVLLADRQTTGGYPVIGTVCTVDLSKFVQCYPGKRIQFSPITLEEAQTLMRQQEVYIETLKVESRDKRHVSQNRLDAGYLMKNANNDEWHHKNIKELINMVNTSSLTMFAYEDETISIKLDKRKPGSRKRVDSHRSENETKSDPDSEQVKTEIISSPLVGLFYRRPDSVETPYVKAGDRVRAGQTVGRVEAMTIDYEIKAEMDGVVRSVLINDGQMVEYSQPIMELEIDKED